MTSELITWRDEYSVGVPEVDYEHQQLIGLINELYEQIMADAEKEAISGFLGEVYAQVSAHFALEEKVMRDCRYDQLDDHKADHEKLLDEIGDIIDRFDANAFFSAQDFGQTLSSWFGEHFATADARFHGSLAAGKGG